MGDGNWQVGAAEGGRLAARWWKWALSAPADQSPVADTTGAYAGRRQPQDVWFLAGTYGGRVVRRCSIPAGRRLFFPVLNTQRMVVPFVTKPWRMEITRASAALNSSPLDVSEFASPVFQIMGIPRVAWGLWCALDPLPPGQFVLEIDASAANGFWVDTTYHLTVEAA
ncbi:hypothetical protein OOK31_14220 [Streptomyces sp. NBC_00249]|uniref:hypothetical protein n=1 Tax=Streptomyces sp. NBC_00249 TaxID=2975690 RepID=UPI0022530325|nr:hypothetical protein [Streptomyces sp. NBC_00249]MCX5195044.1 hypothetical protein [Streptomyces sp. NBC_00249]